MIYPGEYPQPLERVTNVQVPVVGGYITSRLQVQGDLVYSTATFGTSVSTGTLPESGYVDNFTAVMMENTGANTVAVQLLGSNDYTSGPRENVGAIQTLVPLGRTRYGVNPRHTYLELNCLSGTSAIRMQLSSRLKWDELGFDKSDPFYPPFLVNARNPLTYSV